MSSSEMSGGGDRGAARFLNHDFYAGVGFTVVGVGALIIGDGWSERSWVFPNLLSTCLLVCAAVLVVKAFVTGGRARMFASRRIVLDAVGFAGTMAAYLALMGVLGYLLATTLFIWGLSLALDKRGSVRSVLLKLVVSVVAVLALYALFGLFLNVPLPEGAWW